MKCLAIGDVHIKVSNVRETEQMCEKLVELAEKIRPNFIVLLGDVLDRHATIHVHCLMRAEFLVSCLVKIAPVFLLVGNHDRPNNSVYRTNEHPFNAMKRWDNVYIADDAFDAYIHTGKQNVFDSVSLFKTENAYRFIFAPYVFPGRFDESLDKIENPYENTKCVFAHQEIKGAKMGCIVSEHGDDWSLENPLMVSGHIHDYQNLQENMIYTGTPMMHGFGDKDDKTVSVFTFYEDRWEQERIDLGLVKKKTIYLTPDRVRDFEPPEGVLLKLVIRGDEASIKTLMKTDKIQELKRQGIKVDYKTVTNIEPHYRKAEMKYRERLLNEIKDDKNMLSWYHKLFS